MTKIVASIRPTSYEDGEDLILTAQINEADLIELWCDKIPVEVAQRLVIISELPVIVNLKDINERGEFKGNLYERITFLESLLNVGAYLIDIPYSPELLNIDIDRLKDKLILSYHDFEGTPSLDEMENLIQQILICEPAILKFAFTINQEIDLMNILKIQTNRRDIWGKTIFIGMGQKGMVTRMLSSVFKHPFTFAAIDNYSKTAPGQMTIKSLRKVWKQFGML